MISQERVYTNALHQHGKFNVSIASDKKSIDACLRLRYEIFSNEMGANLQSIERGLDKDRFDDICKHLMVVEKSTNRIVATTRLLSSSDVSYTGFFDSETKFDISNVLDLPGHIMEVGRTCIDKDFRKGIVLTKLWQGVARVVSLTKVDYLIGCTCVPITSGDHYINLLMQHLRSKYYSSEDNRVHPLVPLPKGEGNYTGDVIMPTLLKGYIRQGAVICGEPHWDAEFGVADVFVLLDCNNMTSHYTRHFKY